MQYPGQTKPLFNRRSFIASLGAGTLLSNVSFSRAEEQTNKPSNTIQVDSDNFHQVTKSKPISPLNLYSAHAVSTGFLGTLTHAVGINRGQISLTNASLVNALELMRLTTLITCDGDKGRQIAANEVNHLIKDSLPAILMIAASDFAERAIALEPSIIATKLKDNGNYHTSDNNRLVRERPLLSTAAEKAWIRHKNKVTTLLMEHVTQMTAITSVAAPFASTLTSSAFWKEGTDNIAHLCMEWAYSGEIIKSINQGKEPSEHIDKIKTRASLCATELLNGPWGYNQLGIALACNAQGLFGIGSPPNLWFAFNHIHKDPMGCVLSELKGAAFSETQTLLATARWLSRVTGAGFFVTCKEIALKQYKMLRVIKESFSEDELRSTTFGSGSRLAARILPLLHQARSSIPLELLLGDIRNEIKETPTPALQLSLGEWIGRMQSVYKRIIRQFPVFKDKIGDVPDLSADELDSIDNLSSSKFLKSFEKAMTSRNDQSVYAHLEKLQRWKQDRLSQRLAIVLHTIAVHGDAYDVKSDDLIKSIGLSSQVNFGKESFSGLDKEESLAVSKELEILSRALEQLASFSSASDRLRSAQALYTEGVNIESIIQQLEYIHRGTLTHACNLLVNIKMPKENIIESLLQIKDGSQNDGGNSRQFETDSQKNMALKLAEWLRHSWEDPRNLSEPSRDIVRVIATQLPAIPAFSLSMTELIKQFANVKDGELLSQKQLSSILNILPPLGYGIAALADNVPGYLILETVITDLFKQTFTSKVLEAVPHFGTRVGFLSKTLSSQSGMTFPFSSAANLIQENIEVIPTHDPAYPQGFGIKRTKLEGINTINSRYMQSAAAGTISWGILELRSLFREAQRCKMMTGSPL